MRWFVDHHLKIKCKFPRLFFVMDWQRYTFSCVLKLRSILKKILRFCFFQLIYRPTSIFRNRNVRFLVHIIVHVMYKKASNAVFPILSFGSGGYPELASTPTANLSEQDPGLTSIVLILKGHDDECYPDAAPPAGQHVLNPGQHPIPLHHEGNQAAIGLVIGAQYKNKITDSTF